MCELQGNRRSYLESQLLEARRRRDPNFIQVGFKIFLNITPTVTNWSADNKQFSLIFDENPLADFVELPDDGKAQDELWFSNLFCGILRGALEMVNHFSLSDMFSNSLSNGLTAFLRYMNSFPIYSALTTHRCKCRLRLTS